MQFLANETAGYLTAQRPSTEGMESFLVVSTSVCPRPGCPCRDVLLGGRLFVARPDLEIDAGTVFDAIEADGGSLGDRFDARIVAATGEVALDGEQEAGALGESAREALAWLRSDLTPALVAEASAWVEAQRRERDRVREIWHETDWSDWSPGQMVAWDDAFEGPWNDVYEVGGEHYQVFELYCVDRACPCDRVRIDVGRLPEDGSSPEIVGWFDVDRTHFGPPIDLGTVDGMRERVIEVWRLARQRQGERARVEERQAAMHRVGAWLDEHVVKRRPARAAARVGRNDPCPCGSKKKYKKCCGR